ncbi:hypothetical protein DFH06DRAFT_1316520 [Mycena polygramma]|nr:hypothetical protein DFH06DRAFT_1316520 [Mycena polygramma]
MPRVATFTTRPHKLNGPTCHKTPPFPPLRVLCPEPECPWTFKSKADLNRHLPQHMSPEEREKLMYKCTAPGCSFKSLQKSNLKTHFVAKHTEAKPHACPNCPFRTADPGCLNRHRGSIHGYTPNSAPRKTKKQAAALIREAMARSESGSDASGSSSGSWSGSPSPSTSMDLFSAPSDELLTDELLTDELFTFYSPPISPSGLYLDTMSPSSSGSSFPTTPTDSASFEHSSTFYPHPVSPSSLFPDIFPPSPSSSSGPLPSPPINCDAPMLWLPDIDTCVAVVEPTSAPGPTVFYPAEGITSFASDYTCTSTDTASFPAFPASFDLSHFSAPRVYEPAFDFDAALQALDLRPPFSGEWVDVVC